VFCYILTVQNVEYVICINFYKLVVKLCCKVVKLFLKHPVYLLTAVWLTPGGSSTVHADSIENDTINNFGWKVYWDSKADYSS
jgi:hypothetical protein